MISAAAKVLDPIKTSLPVAFQLATRHVYDVLRSYPGLLVFLGGYAAARVMLNLSIGISIMNALRPLLIGLLFHGVSILLMDTIYFWRFQQTEDKETTSRPSRGRSAVAVWLLLGVWLFWVAEIVDGLQRIGAMPGAPILDGLPGWPFLVHTFDHLGLQASLRLPFLPARAYASLFSNLTLRMIVPYSVLFVLGLRHFRSGLTFRRWQIVAPFLLIGFGAWISQGVSIQNIVVLGLVTLYPGLTEELFYRGWMQALLRVWMRPGYAILLTAVVFGLLHLPEYAFVRHIGALQLAFSNVADVILVGVVWGYGVYRTRSVLPWAVYHALTDLVGF